MTWLSQWACSSEQCQNCSSVKADQYVAREETCLYLVGGPMLAMLTCLFLLALSRCCTLLYACIMYGSTGLMLVLCTPVKVSEPYICCTDSMEKLTGGLTETGNQTASMGYRSTEPARICGEGSTCHCPCLLLLALSYRCHVSARCRDCSMCRHPVGLASLAEC